MTRSRFFPLATVALAAVALHAAPARANGRYPTAMQLVQDPTDANRLWLRSTYGMVTTSDRGATWSLVCEAALGMDPNGVFDPMFGVHADGSVVIGLQQGLKRTTDHGCDWEHVVPELADSFVQDIAVDASDRRKGLAISSYYSGTTYVTELWETQNNGASYTRAAHIEDDHYARTIDAAPSDPNRVYLSVLFLDPSDFDVPGVPALLVSSDRGKNWTRRDLPVPPSSDPYIAAVHPTNPDALYVRTYQDFRLEAGNGVTVKSRLLYSEDGGASWREVLSGEAPMLGFALSPDGSEVLVGFGDEGDSRRSLVAPPSAFGIWRSATSDFQFQRVYDQKVSCLYWSGNDVYVCSRLEESGFDLGVFSNDTCPASIRPLFNKKRMTGMLSCPTGTMTNTACTQSVWNDLCDLKLRCSDPWPAADGGPSCWEGGVYEGGTNDAAPTFEAGTADASVSPDGGAPRREPEDDADGCSCRHARRAGVPSPALLAAAVALGLGIWRRRRARR